MDENRQEQIHSKGFNINGRDIDYVNSAYGKIKVGVKDLDDAVLIFGDYAKLKRRGQAISFAKSEVLDALYKKDIQKIRLISNHFYRISGIYQRACDYYSNLYRYDWYVEPEIYSDEKLNEEKIVADFVKKLAFLDNTHVKKMCGEVALKVIVNGAYYGYIIEENDAFSL